MTMITLNQLTNREHNIDQDVIDSINIWAHRHGIKKSYRFCITNMVEAVGLESAILCLECLPACEHEKIVKFAWLCAKEVAHLVTEKSAIQAIAVLGRHISKYDPENLNELQKSLDILHRYIVANRTEEYVDSYPYTTDKYRKNKAESCILQAISAAIHAIKVHAKPEMAEYVADAAHGAAKCTIYATLIGIYSSDVNYLPSIHVHSPETKNKLAKHFIDIFGQKTNKEQLRQVINDIKQITDDAKQLIINEAAQKKIVFCCDCKYHLSTEMFSKAPHKHNCLAHLKMSWVTKYHDAENCEDKRKSSTCDDYEAE